MTVRKLTPKQAAFARAYVETGNGCQAYRRAYDVNPTTKRHTVECRASELLRNGEIAARISELQTAAAERLNLTVDSIVAELAKIAFADITAAIHWDEAGRVTLRPSAELDRTTTAAIAEMVQTPAGLRLKLHDKRTALVVLGKHIGIFRNVVGPTRRNEALIEVNTIDDIEGARRIAFALGRALALQDG